VQTCRYCDLVADRFTRAVLGEPSMGEFVFKASINAVVRVRAADENTARKVVPTVLGAPGTVELRIANEAQAAVGRDANVINVDFDVGSIKLANGGSRCDPGSGC
jgi:hypothetical protein